MERREGLSQGQCVFRSASRRDCHLTPEVLHGPGRVHSVYRSSVNIILENGCFCTLLSPVEDDGPGGILLREPAGFTHPGLALGPGLPVTAERGRLALGKFRVDTASAGTFSSRLVPPAAPAGPEAVERGLLRLEKLLAETPPAGAPELEEALESRAAVLRAVLPDPSRLAEPAVERLVGLGMGLTPSGDDLLTGCLAALLYGGGGQSFPGERLRAAIGKFQDRTAFISGQMLRFAAQGRFRGRLRNFAAAVFSEGDPAPTFRALLGIGASSGRDMARGALEACQILLEAKINE